MQGSFVFRGEVTAVESINQDLIEAGRKHLAIVAAQVFERYSEAPVRVNTNLAEKFLSTNSLSGITSDIDPLGLVQRTSGNTTINTDHKAITSIRDMVERQGSIVGKRLSDIFTDAPYGWSPDTVRYLISAMLLAGEIKLKVAGREVTVNGQKAIDALKTNNTIKSIGVSLREERPSMEVLANAASRLTELSGDIVVPLEDEISKAAIKLFPLLQRNYAPLAEKLKGMDLPGSDRIEALTNNITEVLSTDGSDVSVRLGGEDSEFYSSLKWSADLTLALQQGLETDLRKLQQHRNEINSLPDSGTPNVLKMDLVEVLDNVSERLNQAEFFKYSVEFASYLTSIKSHVRNTVMIMQTEQAERIKEAQQEVTTIAEWQELTQQEQHTVFADLESLSIPVSEDLIGLRKLVNQDYSIQNQLQEIKRNIKRTSQQRLKAKLDEEQEVQKQEGKTLITRNIQAKAYITNMTDLNQLITQLEQLRGELRHAEEFELLVSLDGSHSNHSITDKG